MTALRNALRLYAEADVPFEELAAEVGRAPREEAEPEVRRARALGWIDPDEEKILLKQARRS